MNFKFTADIVHLNLKFRGKEYKMKYPFLLLCIIFPLCSHAGEEQPINNKVLQQAQQEQKVTITGKVIKKIQQGPDGAVWQVETEDQQFFEVMLSIPNLGELYSRSLPLVEEGAVITVTGEQFMLNKHPSITARTLFINL